MNDIRRRARRALLNCLTLGLAVCAAASVPARGQDKSHADAGTTRAEKAHAGHESEAQSKTADYYSCPMHPGVKAKSAGSCPSCGMTLRAVHEDEASVKADNAPNASPVETADGHVSKMNIPDVEVFDQDGNKLHFFSDLVKGKTVAINFIFTTCTTICPPLGATFARVQKDLGGRAGRDLHLISVSVDPVTDTPERMKAWGAKFHAAPGWTFVTGGKPQIDELLRALGASSASREDHSPTVLVGNDARGVWTRAYGLAKPSLLVQMLDDALAGKAASTSNKVSK
jgi:cytochrome oxidase Cu insertion factor (SCO1/SenC/PrrC family)